MEKRSRKRSRKASETEQATEDSSPPPVKSRRRSSAGKLTQAVGKGNVLKTRKKGLTVSFDIAEHSLSVGEGATAGSTGQCTLTLASKATLPVASAENIPRTRSGSGAGAGSGDNGGVVKKSLTIKFKNSDFTVSRGRFMLFC